MEQFQKDILLLLKNVPPTLQAYQYFPLFPQLLKVLRKHLLVGCRHASTRKRLVKHPFHGSVPLLPFLLRLLPLPLQAANHLMHDL